MRDVKRRRSTMNRCTILNLCAVTTLSLALLPNSAASQQRSLKEQLVGSWTIVSNDNVAPDGTKRQIFGPKQGGHCGSRRSVWHLVLRRSGEHPRHEHRRQSFSQRRRQGPTTYHCIGGRRTQNAQSISEFGRTSRNRFQTCEVERAMVSLGVKPGKAQSEYMFSAVP